MKHPYFSPKISADALFFFLKNNYIPAPHSIFENVYKLQPGNILIIDQMMSKKKVEYWRLSNFIPPINSEFYMDEEGATHILESLLINSIQKRMISDVPVGAFLSGGIDSSLIVSLMQNISRKAVKTFTIGFDEKSHNEAKYAKLVARHLGTDLHELYINPKHVLDIVSDLPTIFDEPLADIAQLPTVSVSRVARKEITVCLTGDGGDGLFCGYERYPCALDLFIYHRTLPRFIKYLLARGIDLLTPQKLQKILSGRSRKDHLFKLIDKPYYNLSSTIASATLEEFYHSFVSIWKDTSKILKIKGSETKSINTQKLMLDQYSPISAMSYLDLLNFLPECILAKVDRSSMTFGLEVRTPLSNYRIIEYACKIPNHLKLKDGISKTPLKKILLKYIPESLITRPKMGFSIPISEWLRNDLRECAQSYISKEMTRNLGFFDEEQVDIIWQEHLKGKNNYQHQLWGIIIFQEWAEQSKPHISST